MTRLQFLEETRKRYPGMIILYRNYQDSDFYEIYGPDAKKVSKLLDIPLTVREDTRTGEKLEMTGFPHSQLEQHLRKMLKKKMRVAICDKMENAD